MVVSICCIICRKHIQQSTVKEADIEKRTSEEQEVLTEEEEKKKADSLWSGMAVAVYNISLYINYLSQLCAWPTPVECSRLI
jgi:hypothetical protein